MKFSGKLIHQKITWILFTKVQSYMSLLCFTRHISDFFYNFCLLSGKTPQRLTKYHITYRSDRNTLLYTLTELQAFGLLSSCSLRFPAMIFLLWLNLSSKILGPTLKTANMYNTERHFFCLIQRDTFFVSYRETLFV